MCVCVCVCGRTVVVVAVPVAWPLPVAQVRGASPLSADLSPSGLLNRGAGGGLGLQGLRVAPAVLRRHWMNCSSRVFVPACFRAPNLWSRPTGSQSNRAAVEPSHAWGCRVCLYIHR